MAGQYGRTQAGSGGGQDRRDDDDNNRGNFARGQPQPPCDDRGRFMIGGERQYGHYGDKDNSGGTHFGGRGFNSRDYEERGFDDDDIGWFGKPRGQAEVARFGWRHRR